MAIRGNAIVRVLLILCIFALGWYTVRLYAGLYGKISKPVETNDKIKQPEVNTEKKSKDKLKIEDPDHLVNQKKIDDEAKEWEKGLPVLQVPKFKCEMSTECSDDQYSFKVVSGAANVIGPSLCFNGVWVMRNVLNNVDRGMNIAVINGLDGKVARTGVFDLYGKDSTDLKKFLNQVTDNEIILATSYDDAAFRLDAEARGLLEKFGSKRSKELAFRDNWIFVGGKKIESKENFLKMDKALNKYGDWPEAINLEGCLHKIQ